MKNRDPRYERGAEGEQVMRYRAEIDGLRAVAVVPVILFHAGFERFSGGFVGVDVFFVISGYLITSIILLEMGDGNFKLINFYERRARRILPALFFVMLVCIPFAWMWLVPRDMEDFAQSLIAVSTFSSNILFWQESGYFDTAAELKPLLHTWSLAVEEQYYILFPLFLLLTWRLGTRWILASLAVVFALSLGLGDWGAHNDPAAAFYLLPTRGWEILIGAFVALFLIKRRDIQENNWTAINQSMSLLGLSLIFYSVFSYDNETPFPSLYTLVPTVGTALIILFAVKGTWVNALLASKVFVGIGLISYSAYLWHQPLLAFAKYRSLTEPSKLLIGALCLATLPLAYFSWRFVEKPFRLKDRVPRKAIFSLSIILGIGFVGAGLFGHVQNGFDYRLVRSKLVPNGDVDHIAFHQYVFGKYYHCTPSSIAAEALVWEGFLRCMQSKDSEPIEIALVGDSHAEHLFIGVAERLPEKNVVFYIKGAKPLLPEEEFKKIFAYVASDPNIKVVVLTMDFARKIQRLLASGAFASELRATIKFLVSNGKKVVLVGNVPRFWFDPYRCAYALSDTDVGKCDMDESVVDAYEEEYVDTLRQFGGMKNVEYIELRDLICRSRTCSMRSDGTLLYRDRYHLNIPGSMFVGSELVGRSSFLK